ncbi:50S ribosomal protein L15e [Candidatus Gugararchaeum adminiculabundum]|nr:50S ribosomal protein L15e [Candidatus Gugararchaeum adminiculabundum]
MGAYKHIQETFQQEYKERAQIFKARVQKWKKEGSIERVERPTNLARARTLGYKAKPGFVIVRVRIGKGRRKRKKPLGGREPKHNGRFFSPHKSHQRMAEERACAKFANLEVLNSYWVGEDGMQKYYEVILVDGTNPATGMQWVQRGRAERGLTSAGMRSRSLRNRAVWQPHS